MDQIYIWQYMFKGKKGIEYTFYLGKRPYYLQNQELVRIVRLPSKYLPLAKIELQNKSAIKLGFINCEYTDLLRMNVRLEENFPLHALSDVSEGLLKNTGFGSFLLLMAGAHLKKLGVRKIQSIYLLSLAGKSQLKKAGLERAEPYKLQTWQKGIAKNVRFAKKRLV